MYFDGQRQLVSEVATQGRKEHPLFVTEFDLTCTLDGETWTKIGSFKGNKDSDSIVINKLEKPVFCTAVRFVPKTW